MLACNSKNVHAPNFQIPKKLNKVMVIREGFHMDQVHNYNWLDTVTDLLSTVIFRSRCLPLMSVLEPFKLNPFCVISSSGSLRQRQCNLCYLYPRLVQTHLIYILSWFPHGNQVMDRYWTYDCVSFNEKSLISCVSTYYIQCQADRCRWYTGASNSRAKINTKSTL